MVNLSDIKKQAQEACYSVDNTVIVKVSFLADDPGCICIRVFGAKEQDVYDIEDLIFDLEESIVAESEASLLPMVKTLEVTEEYYPIIFQEIKAKKCARVIVKKESRGCKIGLGSC